MVTNEQIKARTLIKNNRKYLTSQQMRTLNGFVKSGDVVGAMNGLHTILSRKIRGD